jgi:hypothetical protein
MEGTGAQATEYSLSLAIEYGTAALGKPLGQLFARDFRG